MSHLSLVYSAPKLPGALPNPPPQPHSGTVPPELRFTSRDLLALTCWTQRSETHGYRRLLIESGDDGAAPETGGYALIYAPGHDWASWGLTRTGGGVMVWHCGSGAERGVYQTMLAALDSLPSAPSQTTSHRRAGTEPLKPQRPIMRLA